jgi:xanthine dehydrogenase accessory factor
VLVDPTADKDVDAYRQAAAAAAHRKPGLLLTVVHATGDIRTEVLWRPEGDPSGEQATLSDEGDVLILSEPVIPRPLLLIVGGGHVGQALAVQADLLGFDLVVLDDRPEFTAPELFPAGAETRCGDLAAELEAAPLDLDTYVVIVTRGHQHDAEALRACLRRPVAYLGMIGSRRKVALLRQSLLDAGWATADEFDRVHAPIGLDIGAESVPEIAVSIAAELVAVRRRGGSPESLRRRDAR